MRPLTRKIFFITTAIPYVNAPPHVGHAFEFLQADLVARFHRLIGERVFFLSGTDENAQKNVLSAEQAGLPVQTLVDQNTEAFLATQRLFGISTDNFVRTSDRVWHWPGVAKLWQLCQQNGDIYQKQYSGLYCPGCEAFVTRKDLDNGLCPEHACAPDIIEEVNYFFRLSRYQAELEQAIQSNSLRVIPPQRKHEILSFIRGGLEDFSISRPAARVRHWGIPVPEDPSQIVYVWFDALANYISALGFGSADEQHFRALWPADLHVIGKGISRFHAVYWPAILLSAHLPLPRSILVHGYVTAGGKKMGKALGNALDPSTLVQQYGLDAVRYYFLREFSPFSDGNFSEDALIERNNNELVANVGNFVYRTLSFIARYFRGVIPDPRNQDPVDDDLHCGIRACLTRIEQFFPQFRFVDILQEILNVASLGNKYFQDHQPWKLVKTNEARVRTVLYTCAGVCRQLAILLHPFLPELSVRIWVALHLPESPLAFGWTGLDLTHLSSGASIPPPQVIVRKLDLRVKTF